MNLVNDPPTLIMAIPVSLKVVEGGDPLVIDLNEHFADVDSSMMFTATSDLIVIDNENGTATLEFLDNTPKPDDIVDAVITAFDPNDPDRRREGINKLSDQSWGLRDPHLKGYALLLRADEDPTVRSAAARALGKAGDARYLPDLVSALERTGQPAPVRWDVAVALDKVIGDEAVEPLQRHATGDPDVDVRIHCVRALRHYRAEPVLNTLIAALDDEDYGIRYVARESLREMTGGDEAYDMARWRRMLAAKDDPFKRPEPPRRKWWPW